MTAERVVDGFGNRGDGCFVEDDFDALHRLVDIVEAADITREDFEIIRFRQVLAFSGGEIVEHAPGSHQPAGGRRCGIR